MLVTDNIRNKECISICYLPSHVLVYKGWEKAVRSTRMQCAFLFIANAGSLCLFKWQLLLGRTFILETVAKYFNLKTWNYYTSILPIATKLTMFINSFFLYTAISHYNLLCWNLNTWFAKSLIILTASSPPWYNTSSSLIIRAEFQSPENGHKDDQRAEGHLLWRQAESWTCSAWRSIRGDLRAPVHKGGL